MESKDFHLVEKKTTTKKTFEEKLHKCKLQEFDFIVSQDLETKILIAKAKIREAKKIAERKGLRLFVSFSGGKDSIVTSDLVLSTIGVVTHINADSRIEAPGLPFIRKYCKDIGVPLVVKHTDTGCSFPSVVAKHGYPLISKKIASRVNSIQQGKTRRSTVDSKELARFHDVIQSKTPLLSIQCCFRFKKNLLREIGEPNLQFTGIRGLESYVRRMTWARKSCFYALGGETHYMMPIVFWATKDLDKYVEMRNLHIPIDYHLGWLRTGCWPCGCGAHLARPNGYQLQRIWFPQRWYGMMFKWGLYDACVAVGIPTGSELSMGLIEEYRNEKLERCPDKHGYREEMMGILKRARDKDKKVTEKLKEVYNENETTRTCTATN